MGFIFKQSKGETPETVANKRKLAQALLSQGMDSSPIQHPMQGLARIAQALSGNWANSRLDKAEKEGRAAASDNFARIMASLAQNSAPQPAMAPQMASSQPSPQQPSAMPAPNGNTFQKMLQIESGMNPNAVSPKGATGIAQIMPATARDPGFGVPNIFDFAKKQGVQVADNSDATLQTLLRNPQVNAGFGEAYFNAQKQRYGGDERLAAAAYNAGPGAVDKAGGVPNIQETQDYVRKLGLNGQQPQRQQVAQAQPPQPQIQPAAAQAAPDMSAIQQLMEIAGSPWINDGQKSVINAMLQRELAKSDPATQLALQKAQMELQAMQNPGPEYDFINGKDGSVFRADKRTGDLKTLYGPQPDPVKPTADIQEYEYAKKQGFSGTFQDFQIAVKKAGASQVNIDQKAEGAFDKKLAEGQAESFNIMATDGMNARADIAVIGELEGLMAGQGGTMTGLSGLLAKYGIGGDGVSDIQAAQALINKLVPTQRQPGSGSMSDRDVELFTRSLPSLWNSPGGNIKIMNVMKGLAQYKQAQGEIAQRIMTGQISRQDAIRELQALPNPLAGTVPKKTEIDGYTIEQVE